MKLFLKLYPIFIVVLCCSTAHAQNQEWTEQNWQRASGAESEFQNQFPGQQLTRIAQATHRAQQALYQQSPNSPNNVQYADHQQALSQPPRDLEMVNETLEWQSQDGDGEWESAAEGPLKWSQNLQNELGKIDWKKILGSLAVVLGGYFGFVWLTRRFGSQQKKGLPSEVMEVIGAAPINANQQLQLIRLGSKLLVLVSGEAGTHPVAEISDPDEVEYLANLCHGKSTARSGGGSSSSATTFRRTLDRTRNEARTNEDAMTRVIAKLSELAGKSTRTDFEA